MYPFAMIAQSEETAAESRAPLEPRQVIARTVTRMARKRKILAAWPAAPTGPGGTRKGS